MKNQFYYMVAGYEFHDDDCWGTAWKEAKAKAKELHTFVARRVVRKNGDEEYEVFLKGGAFLPARMVDEDRYMIF